MKKVTFLFLITFFTVGTIISILSYEKLYPGFGKSNPGIKQAQALSQNPLPANDWPVYDFDTLVGRADLIAFVDVNKNEVKKAGEGPRAILSTLKVTEILHGSAPDSIILDQTSNIVEPGKSHLLFLNKNGYYYYELSEESIVMEDKGEYNVKIEGIDGVYNKQDLIQKIKSEITISMNNSK